MTICPASEKYFRFYGSVGVDPIAEFKSLKILCIPDSSTIAQLVERWPPDTNVICVQVRLASVTLYGFWKGLCIQWTDFQRL